MASSPPQGQRPQHREALFFALFFAATTANYIITPVRFAVGMLVGGKDNMSYLIYATTGLSVLTAQVLAAGQSGRAGDPTARTAMPRDTAATFFGVGACCFAGLYLAWLMLEQPAVAQQHQHQEDASSSSPSATTEVASYVVACAFFVTAGVLPTFSLSLLWSVAAESYCAADAVRDYGLLSAGATAGSLAGSAITFLAAEAVGTMHLTPLAVVALAAAWWLVKMTTADCPPKPNQKQQHVQQMMMAAATTKQGKKGADSRGRSATPRDATTDTTNGRGTDGWRVLLGSRFLLAICLYNFLYTATSTFIYVERTAAAAHHHHQGQAHQQHQQHQQHRQQEGRAGRVSAAGARGFAISNLVSSVLTLLVQLGATARVTRAIGVGGALLLMPAVTLLGYYVLLSGHLMYGGGGTAEAAVTEAASAAAATAAAAASVGKTRTEDAGGVSVARLLSFAGGGAGVASPAWDLQVLSSLEVLRRLVNYGAAKPVREALFTVVPAEQRRATKTIIDVLVGRAASVASAAMQDIIGGKLGSGGGGGGGGSSSSSSSSSGSAGHHVMGLVTSLVWAGNALLLGRWFLSKSNKVK